MRRLGILIRRAPIDHWLKIGEDRYVQVQLKSRKKHEFNIRLAGVPRHFRVEEMPKGFDPTTTPADRPKEPAHASANGAA